MMDTTRCLCCGELLAAQENRYHEKCMRRLFSTTHVPVLNYTQSEPNAIARQTILDRISVPGVQPKISLHLEAGPTSSQTRLTLASPESKMTFKHLLHIAMSAIALTVLTADAQQPAPAPPVLQPSVIEDRPGYNSWPVIQALGTKLVCAYSRGTAHSIVETNRGIYARTSNDLGKTWTPEVCVANNPDTGDVTIGKGLDQNGAALFWIRCAGKSWHHDLYRTTDGVAFTRIASLKLSPMPMQITDILHVPTIGLMALWFAGNYSNTAHDYSWGTLTSADNGLTWTQRVVESGLAKGDWPTEQCAVYLGDGRLLAIARSENVPGARSAQFQLQSVDYGKTWTKARTNITDVLESTPSLFFDAASGTIANYYYQRGKGLLKRRVVPVAAIWGRPTDWPAPAVVATGSKNGCHAGNVNGTLLGDIHYMAYYSGDSVNTSIVFAPVSKP